MKDVWFSVREALTVTTGEELKGFVEKLFNQYNSKTWLNFEEYCNDWWQSNLDTSDGGNILGVTCEYFNGKHIDAIDANVDQVVPYLEFQDLFYKEHGKKSFKEYKQHVAKPRYHKKRKPVPKRKKTDVKILYSTLGFDGDSYTIKNVFKIQKAGMYIDILSNNKTFDGGLMSTVSKFLVDDVAELQVKTPYGNVDFMRQSRVVWEYAEDLPDAFHIEDRRNNLLDSFVSADFIYNF